MGRVRLTDERALFSRVSVIRASFPRQGEQTGLRVVCGVCASSCSCLFFRPCLVVTTFSSSLLKLDFS